MSKIPGSNSKQYKKKKSSKQYKKKKSCYFGGIGDDVDSEQYKKKGYSWGIGGAGVEKVKVHPLMHHGSLSYISKPTLALKTQIKKLIQLKNHLNDDMDLLLCVDNLIHLATRFYRGTKDLPFHWLLRTFLPRDKRGWKISYPDYVTIDDLLTLRKPDVIYVESDDEEEEECDTPSHSEARAYYLLCLESVSATIHDIYTEKHSRLTSISHYVLKPDARNTALSEICSLETLHYEATAALAQMLADPFLPPSAVAELEEKFPWEGGRCYFAWINTLHEGEKIMLISDLDLGDRILK